MPDISLAAVLPAMIAHPALLVIIVLSMGTLLMNGAHDASNAIATCVATRSMTPLHALIMAAICNFAGVSLATLISTAVAKTMLGMVNFRGDNRRPDALMAARLPSSSGRSTWYLGLPPARPTRS